MYVIRSCHDASLFAIMSVRDARTNCFLRQSNVGEVLQNVDSRDHQSTTDLDSWHRSCFAAVMRFLYGSCWSKGRDQSTDLVPGLYPIASSTRRHHLIKRRRRRLGRHEGSLTCCWLRRISREQTPPAEQMTGCQQRTVRRARVLVGFYAPPCRMEKQTHAWRYRARSHTAAMPSNATT